MVHDLPSVFHYWSNAYLRPRFEALGFSSPDGFFQKRILEHARSLGGRVRLLSVGSGRCEMEIALAGFLLGQGVAELQFDCVELNGAMLRQASDRAKRENLESLFRFHAVDVTRLDVSQKFDVVIANQCLHHFVALERIFDTIHAMIERGGLFVTSDMIGRNGHQLWPEALREVEAIWKDLPRKYKYDRTRGVTSERYINYNHANVGFEGIRAQDILALLVERFEFDLFAPYSCIVMPFIERRFGWNFDPGAAEDRQFIDTVATRDEALIAQGAIKPTQMLACMTNVPVKDAVFLSGLAPRDCVRVPD